MPRRLLYVPVMHGDAEMGSAANWYREAYIARHGEAQWKERNRAYVRIWRRIARAIDGHGLDWTKVKLYQDSLPECHHELAMVRELAAKGSENHRLLVVLIERGANLLGTESPALLIEEYRMLQEGRAPAREAEILAARDRHIAGRIGTTLQADESGILFIGALHDVAKHLPIDVDVTYIRPMERSTLRLRSRQSVPQVN